MVILKYIRRSHLYNMKKYVTKKLLCFDNLDNCLKNINGIPITPKEMLKFKAKLLIIQKHSIIENFDDIQPLYLYPTNILNYIESLMNKNNQNFYQKVMINIIDVDYNVDYIKYFNKQNLNKLKNVEMLIPKDYDLLEYKRITELIDYFSKRGTYISLNIKDLINIPNSFLEKISEYCSYFKIFLPPILNTPQFNLFEEKIKIINEKRTRDSLLHIKTYMNLEQIKYYETAITKFENLNVDVFQVSKELIPIGQKNIPVNLSMQNKIRNLEKISVKLND